MLKGGEALDKFTRVHQQNSLIWGWMGLRKHYRRTLRVRVVPPTPVPSYNLITRKNSHTYTEQNDGGSDKHSTTTHQPRGTHLPPYRSRFTERRERRQPGSAHAHTEMDQREREEDDGFERLVMEKLARLEENMNGWIEGGQRKPRKHSNVGVHPYLSK